jgi:small ligand-binding sensory domain FIST
MPYAAAMSEHPIATQATGEVVGQVLESLGDEPDLAMVFVTANHGGALEDIAAAVREFLRPAALVGVTAVSVLGADREVEEQPAVSLWAAKLGAPPRPVRFDPHGPSVGTTVSGLPPSMAGDPTPRTLVLLADPFSTPVDGFLESAPETYPGLRVVGGLASAARGPGGNRLVLDGKVFTDGAVGVLLPPEGDASTVVSQGCRPIGQPLTVTKSEGRVIYELAGRPALERLVELLEKLDPEDRALAQRGIHLGCVIDEHKAEFERGDFLIRTVLGGDREVGAIAVGDEVEVGATVQFQVRDAASADDDLRALLAGRRASGALVFTCNGRGTHLFGRPDHDAEVVNAHVDNGATAGMFCAGELGPIGDRSFLHGFTASILLFRD